MASRPATETQGPTACFSKTRGEAWNKDELGDFASGEFHLVLQLVIEKNRSRARASHEQHEHEQGWPVSSRSRRPAIR
jgi:hypothetical protein